MGLSRYEKARREELERQQKTVNDALAVAGKVHENDLYQVSGTSFPYIEHVIRVKVVVTRFGWQAQAVALLHDAVESGKLAQSEVNNYFDHEVSNAIAAITRLPSEAYSDYIKRCKKNDIARMVKIADIQENLFWGAGAKLPDKGYTLRPRYLNALKELLE